MGEEYLHDSQRVNKVIGSNSVVTKDLNHRMHLRILVHVCACLNAVCVCVCVCACGACVCVCVCVCAWSTYIELANSSIDSSVKRPIELHSEWVGGLVSV